MKVIQKKQSRGRHLRREKQKKTPALTANRANKTSSNQQNHKHRRGNAEQRSTHRRDLCLSPPHPGDHHRGEHRGGAHPAEGEQAALRIGPQPRNQPQQEAYRERRAEEARPARNTGTLPPAGLELLTAEKTTTTATDHPRSIRHRIAPHQREEEPTSTHPAPPATKWSEKDKCE